MTDTLCAWSEGLTLGVTARVLVGVLWQGWGLRPPTPRRGT